MMPGTRRFFRTLVIILIAHFMLAMSPYIIDPVSGTVSSPLTTIVILAQFPDLSATSTTQDMSKLIFDTLKAYVIEQSYGTVSIQGELAGSWVTLPKTTSQYKSLGFTGACAHNIIQDAISLMDSSVDFSKFKIVVAIFAGTPATTCTPRGFSPETSTVSFSTADNFQVRRVAVVAEKNQLSTVAHEYIHTLGIGDLYDAPGGGAARYIGRWDPMSWPAGKGPQQGYLQGLMAWTRSKLEWIPQQKTITLSNLESSIYTLDPLESPTSNNVLIRIPINSTSHYYIENRQYIGFDSNLPDRGILISLSREDIYNNLGGSGKGPIRLMDARPSSNPDVILDLDDAAFDIGAGEINTYIDTRNDVRIDVLSKDQLSYRLMIGKASASIVSPTATTTTTTSGVSRQCFIATAAYQSEISSEVQLLRNFRDEKVSSTFAGSTFIEVFNAWYYSFSPHVAESVWSNNWTRLSTRFLLYPLIGILQLAKFSNEAFAFNPEVAILTSGFIASFLIGLAYFTPITILLSRLVRRKPVKARSVLSHLGYVWVLVIVAIFFSELIHSVMLMNIGTVSFILTTGTMFPVLVIRAIYTS